MQAEDTDIAAPVRDTEPSWAEIAPPAPAPRALVAEESSRRIETGAATELSGGTVAVWTFVVLGLIAGAALLARRLLRRTGLLAGGGLIKIAARRSLAPRQEVFLVEVGPRLFLIGATRDRLTTLGEFSRPEEVAQLRSKYAPGDSAETEFRSVLRETLRDAERPERPQTVPAAPSYAEVATELAEIRKTVEGWRA